MGLRSQGKRGKCVSLLGLRWKFENLNVRLITIALLSQSGKREEQLGLISLTVKTLRLPQLGCGLLATKILIGVFYFVLVISV